MRPLKKRLHFYPKIPFMKKPPFAIINIFVLQFFCFTICKAQAPGTDSVKAKGEDNKFNLTIATAYASRLHYFGRTDSLKSSALIPTLIIQAGKNFSITPSFIFINNNQASFNYAASAINATYSFGKQKGVTGTLYADKFFYKGDSKLVQASQQGQTGFSLSYLNKIININTGSSAAFSKGNTDFFASAGLDHQFKIVKDENVFLITPAFVANAGTQNFTSSYYKKTSFLFLPPIEQQVTENSKKFSLLSYDVNLSLIYAIKRFIFNITPGYVLPQNVITVANNPGLSEKASNLFYCNAVVAYKIVK